jgi:hypothetical protein
LKDTWDTLDAVVYEDAIDAVDAVVSMDTIREHPQHQRSEHL